MFDWQNWLFFKWGFFGNYWIWFHMLGGGILANIIRRYVKPLYTSITILNITLIWEVYEFIEGGGRAGMIETYGSMLRWFYDSLGDVVGAMIVALLVIF